LSRGDKIFIEKFVIRKKQKEYHTPAGPFVSDFFKIGMNLEAGRPAGFREAPLGALRVIGI